MKLHHVAIALLACAAALLGAQEGLAQQPSAVDKGREILAAKCFQCHTNAMWQDQWDDVPIISQSFHHFPSWSSLWVQHVDNRIFFPNLIAGSIRLTHLPLWWAFFAWQIVTSFLLLWA